MTRPAQKIVIGVFFATVAVATIFATRYVLSLFPSGADASRASEEASFLAHLLLPLSISLLIFVVIAVIGGGIRLILALSNSEGEDRAER